MGVQAVKEELEAYVGVAQVLQSQRLEGMVEKEAME